MTVQNIFGFLSPWAGSKKVIFIFDVSSVLYSPDFQFLFTDGCTFTGVFNVNKVRNLSYYCAMKTDVTYWYPKDRSALSNENVDIRLQFLWTDRCTRLKKPRTRIRILVTNEWKSWCVQYGIKLFSTFFSFSASWTCWSKVWLNYCVWPGIVFFPWHFFVWSLALINIQCTVDCLYKFIFIARIRWLAKDWCRGLL